MDTSSRQVVCYGSVAVTKNYHQGMCLSYLLTLVNNLVIILVCLVESTLYCNEWVFCDEIA